MSRTGCECADNRGEIRGGDKFFAIFPSFLGLVDRIRPTKPRNDGLEFRGCVGGGHNSPLMPDETAKRMNADI